MPLSNITLTDAMLKALSKDIIGKSPIQGLLGKIAAGCGVPIDMLVAQPSKHFVPVVAVKSITKKEPSYEWEMLSFAPLPLGQKDEWVLELLPVGPPALPAPNINIVTEVQAAVVDLTPDTLRAQLAKADQRETPRYTNIGTLTGEVTIDFFDWNAAVVEASATIAQLLQQTKGYGLK